MPFSYKLVAFDLDGTTLQHPNHFDDKIISALEAARATGAQISVATGRPLRGIPERVRTLACLDYVICANGAQVFDAKSGELLREKPISSDIAFRLLDLFRSWKAPYQISFAKKNTLGFAQLLPTIRRMKGRDSERTYKGILTMMAKYFDIVLSPTRLIKTSDEPIHKICTYTTSPEKTKEHIRILTEQFPELIAVTTGGYDIEITMREATKGAAISFVAQRSAIEKKDILFFGDSGNDATAKPNVGHFVAMSTSSEDVLALADQIAPPASELGVAQVLNELLSA